MSDPHKDGCLGDFVALQRGNTYKGSLLGRPGPVLLGLASIARNGGFRADNLKTYGGASDERMILRPGDIYVSLKDVTQSADLLGAVSRVPDFIESGRLTQDTVKLEFKTDIAPKTYIYWLLRTPEYRAYCKAHATGTTNLGLAREDFFSFPVPALTAQRETLVTLIQSIDDKIEGNRRMHETLEGIAREVFKDWFVDFGPTRAKAQGRPAYLAPEIWALFPASLDKDGYPAGWTIHDWKDLASLEYGKRIEGYQTTPGNFPVFGTNGLIGRYHEPLCPDPGIIIGRKGAYRGVHYSDDPFYVIDTAFYLKPKVPYSSRWAFYTIHRYDINSMDSGSAIPSTSRDDFYNIKVLLPPLPVQEKFDAVLGSIWDKQRINLLESKNLEQLRDLLLPKLLSGEVRFKAAMRTVEDTL